jgi:hypothetical protein
LFSKTISCPEEREPRATLLSTLSFFLRLFFPFFPWGRKWRYFFVNKVGTVTKKFIVLVGWYDSIANCLLPPASTATPPMIQNDIHGFAVMIPNVNFTASPWMKPNLIS